MGLSEVKNFVFRNGLLANWPEVMRLIFLLLQNIFAKFDTPRRKLSAIYMTACLGLPCAVVGLLADNNVFRNLYFI